MFLAFTMFFYYFIVLYLLFVDFNMIFNIIILIHSFCAFKKKIIIQFFDYLYLLFPNFTFLAFIFPFYHIALYFA